MTPPLVSVVLPVYQTGTFLPELHRRLSAALADTSHELVFVDDASPDQARAVLEDLSTDPAVVVVRLDANVGQQRAIMVGLRAARGDAVCVMDTDLQDPPEALPDLLAALAAPTTEAVFATRQNQYGGLGRTLTGRGFKWVLRRVVPIPRGAGSYVALRRSLVERLLALPGTRPYLVAMVGAAASGIGQVDVPRLRRTEGRSAWTSRMRFRAAATALYDARFTWRGRWT